jgi:hypothetical protein
LRPQPHIAHQPRRLPILPTTDLGRWAVGLAAAFLPLVFAPLPRAAGVGLLCAVAGGLAASVAIVRDGERGVLAFVALVPFAIATAFGIAQLI